MRFKKIALALFACVVLGAFAANAAQAAQWTLGTEEDQKGGGATLTKEGIKCKKHPGSELILHSTVLGAPITLKAEQIDCEEAFINTVAVDAEAHSEGFLNFTNVTVEPSTCSVVGGNLTTEKLTDKVIMDPTNVNGPVYDKFFPEVEGGAFVTVKLAGESCPFKGVEAPVKGTACGEAVHTITPGTYTSIPTGTLFKEQTLLFSQESQETGGCALTLGKAAASLTGAVDNTLNGAVNAANNEKPFGAD